MWLLIIIICSDSFSLDSLWIISSCISDLSFFLLLFRGRCEFFKRTNGWLASVIFSTPCGWLVSRLRRNDNTASWLAHGLWRFTSRRCPLVCGCRLNRRRGGRSYFCSCVNEKKKRAESSETRLSFLSAAVFFLQPQRNSFLISDTSQTSSSSAALLLKMVSPDGWVSC